MGVLDCYPGSSSKGQTLTCACPDACAGARGRSLGYSPSGACLWCVCGVSVCACVCMRISAFALGTQVCLCPCKSVWDLDRVIFHPTSQFPAEI